MEVSFKVKKAFFTQNKAFLLEFRLVLYVSFFP
jgi:hypothetical protein